LSHLKERKEKECLNCNAIVHGRYCSVCGQENIEPKESVWHLVTHFFNDITHFDGKFFSTLKLLIFKPGFLSTEYRIGRRASYLNPIRMYIFTSAVFFLLFFSLYDFKEKFSNTKFNGYTSEQLEKMDSAEFKKFTRGYDSTRVFTPKSFRIYSDSLRKTTGLSLTSKNYKTKEEYDSVLNLGIKKHNWLERKIIYKQIKINQKYNFDQDVITREIINTFIHSFPQMLFISLPLFALFLKLLYVRRKQFFYLNHAIFSVHIYIFTFFILLILMLINQATANYSSTWLNWVIALFYIWIFVYLYKAMRNFYGQRRAKTIIKYLLLLCWLVFVVSVLFLIFLFFSFLKT